MYIIWVCQLPDHYAYNDFSLYTLKRSSLSKSGRHRLPEAVSSSCAMVVIEFR